MCTWPITGTAPTAASPPISSTFLRIFISCSRVLSRLLADRPGAESRYVPRSSAKENLLWNLDVWGTASGGHGQAEVRDDTTSPWARRGRNATSAGRLSPRGCTIGPPNYRMPQNDVTAWLVAWGKGDPAADSRLMEAVYADLRRVARRRLRAERGDHSLTPTALVHEAYVRLVDLRRVRWQNRVQFFAIAARLMRRVLVDHARGHAALKRGGGGLKVSLSDHAAVTPPRDVELIDLAIALNKLATINPRLTDLVVMRFFGGLTIEETAEVVRVVAGNRQARLDPRPGVAVP